MTILFWASILFIVLIYAGYPALLWCVSLFHVRPIRREEKAWKRLSVLIPAHNEEKTIEAVVRNKLAAHYPADLLEVIVVSDASTDGTEAAVKRVQDPRVKFIVQPKRRGKNAALDRAVEVATGEILVLADANSMYTPDSLARLVENFADPSVAYVTGKMRYLDRSGTPNETGCVRYIDYENWIRRLESQVGSLVSVCGGIDAVRKSLYEPTPAELFSDFYLPLRLIEQGHRVVYDDRAILLEPALDDPADEWKMRVRVVTVSYCVLWHMKRIMNPFRFGFFSIQLLMHKVLRYAVFISLITLLVSNLFLLREGIFYQATCAGQLVLYAAAFAGRSPGLKKKGRWLGPGYYFCLLNTACLVGLFKFLAGKVYPTWEPRKG